MSDAPLIAYKKVVYQLEGEKIIGRIFVNNSCRETSMSENIQSLVKTFGDEYFDPNLIEAYGNPWQKAVNNQSYKLDFNDFSTVEPNRRETVSFLIKQIMNLCKMDKTEATKLINFFMENLNTIYNIVPDNITLLGRQIKELVENNKIFNINLDATEEQLNNFYYIFDKNFLYNAVILYPKMFIFSRSVFEYGQASIFGPFSCSNKYFGVSDYIREKIQEMKGTPNRLLILNCASRKEPLPANREQLDNMLFWENKIRFILVCNDLYYNSVVKEMFKKDEIEYADEDNLAYYSSNGYVIRPCCSTYNSLHRK